MTFTYTQWKHWISEFHGERPSADGSQLEIWGYTGKPSYLPGEYWRFMYVQLPLDSRLRYTEMALRKTLSIVQIAIQALGMTRRWMHLNAVAVGRLVSRYLYLLRGAVAVMSLSSQQTTPEAR
jgi:hypothetical protein